MSGGFPIRTVAHPPTVPVGQPDPPQVIFIGDAGVGGVRVTHPQDDTWTAPARGWYDIGQWPPQRLKEYPVTDPIDTAEQDAAQYGPSPTAQGVRGYRDLEPEEVALINGIKQLEEQVAAAWHTVRGLGDKRWTAVARTHLQEGFSAMVRSIAMPHDPFDTPEQ